MVSRFKRRLGPLSAFSVALALVILVGWQVQSGAAGFRDLFRPDYSEICPDCGAFALLRIEAHQAEEKLLAEFRASARFVLRDKRIKHRHGVRDDTLVVELLDPNDSEAMALARRSMEEGAEGAIVRETPKGAEARLEDEVLLQARKDAVTRSLNNLKRRMDAARLGAVNVVQFEESCVLMLFRELEDLEPDGRVREIIGSFARLTVHLVVEDWDPDAGNPPPRTQVLSAYNSNADGAPEKYLVTRRIFRFGERIVEAVPTFGANGEAVVTVRLDAIGAKRLEKVTREFVGRRLAFALDDRVLTAPVIHAPIEGGTFQIFDSYTAEEATSLATLLDAGPLPVDITDLGWGSLEDGRIPSSLDPDCSFRADSEAEAAGAENRFLTNKQNQLASADGWE